MVNGLNNNFYAQGVYLNRAQKQNNCESSNVTNPIDKYTMAGLESLGIYNMNLIKNKDKFEHEPASLIVPSDKNFSDIEGEKILDPFGKVEYILQKDEDIEIRYYPCDDENKVKSAEIRDLTTGKLLKVQDNMDFGDYIEITEYPTNESNINYVTSYNVGKLRHITKNEELSDGSFKSYSKNFYSVNPTYDLYTSDKNDTNSIRVDLDSKNMVKNINVYKKIGNTNYSKSIDLNNGAIINVYESKDTTMANFMERDVLNDNDVIPTDKFDKNKIEKIAMNSSSEVYKFNGNGSLKEYFDGKTKVEFNEDDSQIIKEYYDKDVLKITEYEKNGRINVKYKNGNIIKTLYIDKNNKPEHYSIEQDGKCLKSFTFSEEGYLKYSD